MNGRLVVDPSPTIGSRPSHDLSNVAIPVGAGRNQNDVCRTRTAPADDVGRPLLLRAMQAAC